MLRIRKDDIPSRRIHARRAGASCWANMFHNIPNITCS